MISGPSSAYNVTLDVDIGGDVELQTSDGK